MPNRVLAIKKVFNDLNELINNTKNKKSTRKSAIRKKGALFLIQINRGKKGSTAFQNKMTDVVYFLFNSLGIISEPDRLMLLKWIKVSEEIFNKILNTVTEAKSKGFKANEKLHQIMLKVY